MRDKREESREGERPEFTVWVPEGSSLCASDGVQVRAMGSDSDRPRRQASYPPRVRRKRRSERKTAAEQVAGTGQAPAGNRAEEQRPAYAQPDGGYGGKPRSPRETLEWIWRQLTGQNQERRPPAQAAPWAGPGSGARRGPADRGEPWGGEAGGKPWGGGENLAVPPEMEAQAQRAIARYDMKVTDMKVMATKPEKGGAIWRIETNHGPRSLKLLHRPLARSLFSIGAQDYLVKQGARVPELIPARDGGLYTPIDGKVWIVTDWVEGLVQATKVDLSGAAALCYGLGEFHRLSRGYVPPQGAYTATRLYRWPKTYQKVLTKMGWFRELARAYSETPASATLLSLIDQFEQQARDAITRLEASPYASLIARGNADWGIVHQDE